jgi:hypothetical protein
VLILLMRHLLPPAEKIDIATSPSLLMRVVRQSHTL